jgi:lipoic acid synthetase
MSGVSNSFAPREVRAGAGPLRGREAQVVRVGRGERAFAHLRLPEHCRPGRHRAPELAELEKMLRRLSVATVCEGARCPNRSSCWSRRAVTFLLMGNVCTRSCGFCAVSTGRPPAPPDLREPDNVARAAEKLELRHVVLTSVDRDDMPDGGASHFAVTIRAVRARRPEATVEVLTPDFRVDPSAVGRVCDAEPEVYGHNLETVPSLYRRVRPGASFERSLRVLAEARRLLPSAIVKSGLMLGLGETAGQVREVLHDLRGAGVDAVTLGQYLRPSRHHLPVERYWAPEEFDALAVEARSLGFAHVASSPLSRSSYDAAAGLRAAREARGAGAG